MRQTVVALAVLLLAAGAAVSRSAPAIPYFWDADERPAKPDLSELTRLRFLTTTDFRPFNFLDEAGRLTGFHVDLARAICRELEIENRCQIQALPWEELAGAIESGQGDAVIAGLAITRKSREVYDFSRPFLQFPARFVMRRPEAAEEPLYEKLRGKRVGTLDETAHERMLRDLFSEVKPVVYTRRQWMLDDLRQGKIDAVFGDGMQLSFWLADDEEARCCTFAGGPYLAPEYLGHGLAIAVAKGNRDLVQALDYALRQIESDGTFAELYLRYFPVGFY
jgi:polar amino acid transport system substrate-binding protein